MNREEKQKALEQLMGMSEETFDQLARMLCSQMRTQIDQIKAAFTHNDREKISQIAHSLAGCSGNLRMNSIYTAARVLEDNQQTLLDDSSIIQHINQLEQLHDELEESYQT